MQVKRFTRSNQDIIKVCAIGDSHDSPEIPKDRFRKIGEHILKTRPDVVVHIGDLATLDSLNGHVDNASLSGKKKTPFSEDLRSLDQALSELMRPIKQYNRRARRNKRKTYKPSFVFTTGNHENRAVLYGERNPEIGTHLWDMVKGLIEKHGFQVVPYKQYYYIDDVAFTHAPHNGMGKPMGGENTSYNAANKITHDLVHGHTHRLNVIRRPKLGHENSYVQVIDLGTSLPQGHIEDYAKHNISGWSWGIVDMTINGRIQDFQFWSMDRVMKGDSY